MRQSASAWFREPWVWLLLGIPATSVAMGIVLLVLAVNSDDGLVADDYYKRGKEINRVLERDEAAWRHGIGARARFEANRVEVLWSAQDDSAAPDTVLLALHHPTRAGQDQVLVLDRIADGHEGTARYRAPLPAPLAGRWLAELAANDWRLTAEWTIDAQGPQELTLLPRDHGH